MTTLTRNPLPFFINGDHLAPTGRPTYPNVNPIDGSLSFDVLEANADDIDHAVAAARSALNGEWSRIDSDNRAKVLYRVADLIDSRREEFLRAEITDTGKPASLAGHIDIPRGAANFRVFADVVKNLSEESFRMQTPDGGEAINYTVRKPKGVVAVICPWNLPLLLMTWKVAPALACGNAVVVKPSEETPATATLLGEVMNEAGIPAGVYNVVHGFGPDSAGEHLSRHPDIAAVTFTGETSTGAAIMKCVANDIKDVSFELGGKNPGIVFADADFDQAVEGTARSVFANCGQVCLSTERLYVERPVFERFTESLVARAERLVPGDPYNEDTTIGPLISNSHRDKVLGYYQQATDLGAQLMTGGGTPEVPNGLDGGWWIEPTIWTGLEETSPVVREEIFGPCCHISPFDEIDEVVIMANDTEYGLASTIWTQDVRKANLVAARMESGITWVNCWFLRDLRTPFGGAKKSGIGREGGEYSMEFYMELQNICLKV
ncbi:MAG: 2-hydroxymuconic semialdehyde dehydrogenase [Pseudomonadota bacterium]|nr:2-hydroxymuconic semialdehyde dehydrogenase [Pseudomonadota bacterium]